MLGIVEMGSALFRAALHGPGIKSRLLSTLHTLILEDRRNELFDRTTIKGGLDLLTSVYCVSIDPCSTTSLKHEISIYIDDFEKTFLLNSRQFFEIMSAALLSTGDAVEYLTQAEKVLIAERDRSLQCFPEVSRTAVIEIAQNALLKNCLKDIFRVDIICVHSSWTAIIYFSLIVGF